MDRRKRDNDEDSRNLASPGQMRSQMLKVGGDISVVRGRGRLNQTEKVFVATTQLVNSSDRRVRTRMPGGVGGGRFPVPLSQLILTQPAAPTWS